MPVVSPIFIGFIILVGIFTLAIPKARLQQDILLLASLFFYASFGAEYLIFVLTVAGLSYFGAMRIAVIDDSTAKHTKGSELSKSAKQELREKNEKKRRLVKILVIIFIMTIWVLGKISASFEQTGFILPIGISFYSFTAVGYLIDVSRGKYKPEPKFGSYLLFITYFPHIIQGPFSRWDELAPSLLEVHRFDWERIASGTCRVIWGYAKKILVADQLSLCVTPALADPCSYPGSRILLSLLLYGVQLYADFSGYMDIMCGISQIYGIKLAENFSSPFLSGSVREFWKRWNITFISWMKDYVYAPLCCRLGKKDASEHSEIPGKAGVNHAALFLTWTLIGFWHGAKLNMIIWGWLNAALIIAGTVLNKKEGSKFSRPLRMIRTYLLLTVLGSFGSVSGIAKTSAIWKQIFTCFGLKAATVPAAEALTDASSAYAGAAALTGISIAAVILGIVAIFAVDILSERGKWEQLRDGCPVILKSLVTAVLLIAMVLFAGNGVGLTGTFMYAGF